jgi:type VI secretion system protein ImpK
MEPEQEQMRQETQAALDECFDQIRFARATELARAGKYPEAESLLSPPGQPAQVPRDLDLLARMAAQQGRYADARRFWEAALKIEPENNAYALCLEHLDQAKQGAKSGDPLPNFLIVAAIVFGLAVLIYAFFFLK